MNLIDRVVRLKEQHAAEASATYQAASDEFRYECDMLNASPALLEVLGGFQPGDSAVLSLFVDFVEHFDINGHLTDKSDITTKQGLDCLRRLQAMAAKMEEPDAR